MAIEQDAANDGKKSLVLGIAGAVIVGAGIYLGWGWLHRAEPTPSNYKLNSVANNAAHNSVETAQYRKLQSEANNIGGKTADSGGNSFVASLRMSDVKPVAPTPALQPVSLNTTTVTPSQGGTPDPGMAENQKAALNSYMKLLNERWKPGGMQLANSFGQNQQGNGQSGSTSDNAFSAWSQGLPGNAPVTESNTPTTANNAAQDLIVVPPNTLRPGVIDTAIDSDNLNSIVKAHIPAGFLAGASFTARGIQLAGNGVIIHLTRMTLNGIEYQVDAYALQDDTLQSSVASDVNNRYISRILLPAVATGLGGLGELYKQQNTQILSTNAGTISGGTGSVKGSAVAGTIIGGIGSQAGQVMASDAAKLPVQQVRVFKNQVVAIQFMKGVYESDRLNKNAASIPTVIPQTGAR
ncbi:conjugal transfer protein TraO (plasmid) [Yersinia massiliensis]|uniref:conjugal transfer protein TraO n=1 Tax=Yersinia massiliensis TaxID=419257 RepID=UPI001561C748|nr:conjugal transfer protein TraO [Yersinia massiliensis]QKJ09441.1 conjugal transfer protein TraO [Yersinia massiliensis]